MNCEVRAAILDDAPAIRSLCRQLGYDPSESEVALALEDATSNHAVLAATVEGAVIGWIEVLRQPLLTSGDEALICGLVVSEIHRGSGIGRLLVAAAEKWARATGAQTIRVRSRESRERAHRFYFDLGYEEYKRQVVFRKPLA